MPVVKDQCLRLNGREKQSHEAPLAPLTRMEQPRDIIVRGSVDNEGAHHDHDANPQIGCSAFIMFPNVKSKTNKRAFGQANRYMSANARKQSEQDTGGTPGMKSIEASTGGRDYDSKSVATVPVDEDRKIAESTAITLLNISKGAVPSAPSEQPTEIYLPEFEEMDMEQLSTVKPIGRIRKATSTSGYHCVEPLCEYFSKGFTSKARRDCHVLGHYNRATICEFCSVNIPLGLRSFASVHALKDHICFRHICDRDPVASACTTCNRHDLSPEGFPYHIEDCVLRWMEDRATEDPMKCSINYGVESPLVS